MTDESTAEAERRRRLEEAERSAASTPHRGSTETPIPEKVREGARTHGPKGTTHDPNSVTTGTEVEPDDRYPPKGEGRRD
ncbi:hypothetical protein [Jannaschia sp. W003]|uniref:hypothetical protein n=1 Tax=Jannaschia sp. W003 TaxID=2867012 RepID=UPI0021A4AA00|nr:hypothetical protein [Jannaschia sp. W003]UWQ22567.1 hypothetical protein K3554_05955 [Jannaschia sp. W003]